MRFNLCEEVFLFGLKSIDAPSASNWTERSVDNWEGIVLPKTFEELEQTPLNRTYNFLMSLDKESIDKEVEILGIEAHMFWELPKVREMFNELCKRWFYSDNKNYTHAVIDVSGHQATSTEVKTTDTRPSNVIVGSEKEKRQCVELGFVDKLIELWKLRKRLL